MHELGITRNLVALVAERAQTRRVRRVWLEIGTHAGLLPEAVRFCFEVVARGTVLEGAVLEILTLHPGRHCRSCHAAAPASHPGAACARCGGELRLCRGDEINVSAMELDVAEAPCV